MSKNSMPLTIATLLIAAFVHNTAFAQAANYQPYQSTGRLAMTQRTVGVQPKNTLSHHAASRKRMTQINSYCRRERILAPAPSRASAREWDAVAD
jgi:hypothetical protein